jgi:NADPH:quinone reductase-like Zn-dependent oxidoreductase
VKALLISEHGPPEVLRVQERPDPEPGPGEVRVRVRAAGINFADLLARVGLYPESPKPPCVVGYEFGGDVESLGEGVEGLAVGDRVLGGCRFGGYAELVVTGAIEHPAARRLELREGRRPARHLRDRLRRPGSLRQPTTGGARPATGRRRLRYQDPVTELPEWPPDRPTL